MIQEIFIWKLEQVLVARRQPYLLGTLYKMYSKFSEKNKWDIEIIKSNISDHGGFKEVIFKI
jgi:hypothetical protein